MEPLYTDWLHAMTAGQSAFDARRYPDAIAQFQEAAAHAECETTEGTLCMMTAHRMLARSHCYAGNLPAALSTILRALEHASTLADGSRPSLVEHAQCEVLHGQILEALDRLVEASLAKERALALFERAPDEAGAADLLADLGADYWDLGRLDDAEAAFSRAETFYASASPLAMSTHVSSLARCRSNKAGLLRQLCRFDEALACSLFAAAHFELQNGEYCVSVAEPLTGAAQTYIKLDRPDAALAALQRARLILEKRGDSNTFQMAVMLTIFSSALVSLGDFEAAQRDCEQAIAVYRVISGSLRLLCGTASRPLQCVSLGDFEAALRDCEQAIAVYRVIVPPDHPNLTVALQIAASLQSMPGGNCVVVHVCRGGVRAGKRADGAPLDQCAGCLRMSYCSVASHTADWKAGHKKECRAVREAAAVEAAAAG